MRSIAEFIMRGRSQAVMIALLGSWVPVLTQATVGLVTLRKGWQEGLLVLMWAILPALAAYWIGDVGVSLAFSSIAVILVSYACATVLRVTVSWPAALAAIVALSCLGAFVTAIVSGDLVAEMKAFTDQMLKELDDEAREKLFNDWTQTWCTGLVGFWIAVSAFIGLIIARWWQAILYNPGGFREEFHRMRLNTPLALVSAIALGYCEMRGSEYGYWANLFALPLVLAGLGLLHCLIARFRLGAGVVVVSYFLLFMLPVFALMLALVGFTDVLLDYRKRFKLVQ